VASQLSLRSTLIVAIPSGEGIVLGADSRITAGGEFVDGDMKLQVVKGPPCLVYCITGTYEFREVPPMGVSLAEALPHLRVTFDGADVARSILESRLPQNLTSAEAESVGRALGEALGAHIRSDRALAASFQGQSLCRLCLFQVSDEGGAMIASIEILLDTNCSVVLGPVYGETFGMSDLCDAKFAGEFDFVKRHVLAGPGRHLLSPSSSALLSSLPLPVQDMGAGVAAKLAAELILAASVMAATVPAQTGIGGPIQLLLLKRDVALDLPAEIAASARSFP
jgi:hypothetical protein